MKRRTPSIVYLTCIVLLLISNLALLLKVRWLREDAVMKAMGIEIGGLRTLVSDTLQDDRGNEVTLTDSSGRYLILFLFSATDCPACLEELVELEIARHARSDVDVYAVMSYASHAEIVQTKNNFNVELPLLQDPNGNHLQRLKPPKTPWKVIIDRSTGKIILEDPPSNTEVERKAFLNRIMAL